MKKIFGIVMLVVAAAGITQAQDTPELKSRKGELILPEADEWALGVSANPFLGYLGNFLNGNTSNAAPGFQYPANVSNQVAVFGKYMKDEYRAYRIRFNVSVGSRINKQVVAQDELTPALGFPSFTEDWQKINTTTIMISPGYERRRGTTRLQGVYGGELVLGYTASKVSYQYGNPFTSDFNAPTTTDFGNNIVSGNSGRAGTRMTENKAGGNFLVGARGFIGVEYFFAPKISIGGEFGYMFGFQTQKKSLITSQTWDEQAKTTRDIKTDVYTNNGLTTLGIGLDNLSGNINLLFYF